MPKYDAGHGTQIILSRVPQNELKCSCFSLFASIQTHRHTGEITISLEKRLRALAPGQKISLADIAKKQGKSEEQIEGEILELLERDPILGSFDTFAGIFTRDIDLGKAIEDLRKSFVDWERVKILDNTAANAMGVERLVPRAEEILKAVGHLGDMMANKQLDVCTLSDTDRNVLHDAFLLLSIKKDKERISPLLGNATLWLRAGLIAQKIGWVLEAARFFENALALQPKDPAALKDLATIRKVQGNLKGAVEACQQALSLDPKYADLWFFLGNLLHIQKNFKEATKAFEQAVSILPKDVNAWLSLGYSRYALQDLTGAAIAFEQAISVDPENVDAWINLGATRGAQKDFSRAIEAFERALTLDPEMHETWYNLGVTYAEKKDFQKAIKAYERALALNPSNPNLWFNLAFARASQDDIPGAVAANKRVLAIDPKYADAWSNLGVALEQLGKHEEALYCWEQAIKLGNIWARKYAEDARIKGFSPKIVQIKCDNVENL